MEPSATGSYSSADNWQEWQQHVLLVGHRSLLGGVRIFSLLPCFFGAKLLCWTWSLHVLLSWQSGWASSPPVSTCLSFAAAECAGPCLLLGLWHLTSATLAWAARALTHRAIPPVQLFLFLYKLYAKLVHLLLIFFSCSSPSDWFPCLHRHPYFYLQDTFCVSV